MEEDKNCIEGSEGQKTGVERLKASSQQAFSHSTSKERHENKRTKTSSFVAFVDAGVQP